DGYLADPLIHHQRENDSYDQPDRDGEAGVVERVVERLPEQRVADQVLVVGQPDRRGVSEPGVRLKAEVQGVADRVQGEGEKANHPRKDEWCRSAQVSPVRLAQVETGSGNHCRSPRIIRLTTDSKTNEMALREWTERLKLGVGCRCGCGECSPWICGAAHG